MQVVYTVCGDEEEAGRISRALVEEKLAACTNSWKISSTYEWDGELKEEEEVAMIVKTKIERVADVFEKIKEMHSYDTPAILVLPTGVVDPKYLEWVEEQTGL